MTTRHLHNEARGYEPERKKGVPKQGKAGHAEANTAHAQDARAPDAGAGVVPDAAAHGDPPGRPPKGKGKSV